MHHHKLETELQRAALLHQPSSRAPDLATHLPSMMERRHKREPSPVKKAKPSLSSRFNVALVPFASSSGFLSSCSSESDSNHSSYTDLQSSNDYDVPENTRMPFLRPPPLQRQRRRKQHKAAANSKALLSNSAPAIPAAKSSGVSNDRWRRHSAPSPSRLDSPLARQLSTAQTDFSSHVAAVSRSSPPPSPSPPTPSSRDEIGRRMVRVEPPSPPPPQVKKEIPEFRLPSIQSKGARLLSKSVTNFAPLFAAAAQLRTATTSVH